MDDPTNKDLVLTSVGCVIAVIILFIAVLIAY